MSRARSLRAVWAVGLLAALSRCARDPTALYVTVTAEAMPMPVRSLSVRVFQPPLSAMDGASMPAPSDAREIPMVQLPASFLVVPAAGATTATVQIDVEGFFIPTPPMPPATVADTAFDRVLVTFQTDQVLDVPVVLRAGCTLRTCAVDARCDASHRCVAAALANPNPHPE